MSLQQGRWAGGGQGWVSYAAADGLEGRGGAGSKSLGRGFLGEGRASRGVNRTYLYGEDPRWGELEFRKHRSIVHVVALFFTRSLSIGPYYVRFYIHLEVNT